MAKAVKSSRARKAKRAKSGRAGATRGGDVRGFVQLGAFGSGLVLRSPSPYLLGSRVYRNIPDPF
jgi:hypothetical protein